MIRIVSFNVLASNFVLPSYYPTIEKEYLNINYRRERILSFLRSIHKIVDIIGLQEVTKNEFQYYKRELSNYYNCFVPHDKGHWSTDIPNGNALFINKDKFDNPLFYDINLAAGNHCIKCDLFYHGVSISIFNIHLEDENKKLRELQYNKVLSSIDDRNVYLDLIIGDFNMEHGIETKNFKDTLSRNPTFFDNISFIDHILYRSDIAEVEKGEVLIKNVTGDIGKYNFIFYGSDHIPVQTIIKI